MLTTATRTPVGEIFVQVVAWKVEGLTPPVIANRLINGRADICNAFVDQQTEYVLLQFESGEVIEFDTEWHYVPLRCAEPRGRRPPELPIRPS